MMTGGEVMEKESKTFVSPAKPHVHVFTPLSPMFEPEAKEKAK